MGYHFILKRFIISFIKTLFSRFSFWSAIPQSGSNSMFFSFMILLTWYKHLPLNFFFFFYLWTFKMLQSFLVAFILCSVFCGHIYIILFLLLNNVLLWQRLDLIYSLYPGKAYLHALHIIGALNICTHYFMLYQSSACGKIISA